jgi:hypothetical protein
VTADFIPTFLAVALLSAGSPLMFRALTRDSGSELLTRRVAAGAEATQQSAPT